MLGKVPSLLKTPIGEAQAAPWGTPFLQLTTPAQDCKHTKAKENCQLSAVQTATGSSDSPAAHVLLLLGLVRQTLMGPSAPQGLTRVFPVSLSPSPGKLESNRTHSGVDIHTTGLSE